jgi:uncharacterized membrane protein YkvA (DUF1232 family)
MSERPVATGFLQRIIRDAGLAVSLLRDYRHGSYRLVPGYSLLAIVLALLYICSPLDFVPDFLPLVGLVDDTLVAVFCLSLVERDLRVYEQWQGRTGRRH